ncbi:hypothetical protein [Paenibacillus thermotolerans]|uniref:hypothetical protein n=1 Tax=Paenibacillus thermotolerans TaxID=3027807 RepID=UPI002368DBB1|nr:MULTISPECIES: hypothetical protein [unclassified Paenibacillus]
MLKIISYVTVFAVVTLQYSLCPGLMTGERHYHAADGLIEKVNKNGVLERRPKLRSRLNTHLIYKKNF